MREIRLAKKIRWRIHYVKNSTRGDDGFRFDAGRRLRSIVILVQFDHGDDTGDGSNAAGRYYIIHETYRHP